MWKKVVLPLGAAARISLKQYRAWLAVNRELEKWKY